MLSLINEIKAYLVAKYEVTRLDITQKTIIGINLIVQIIIIAFLSAVILVMVSFTLATYIGNCWNNMILGFLAVTGMDILILLMFIIFRKTLILKPLSKILIQLLLTEDKEGEEEEADEEGSEI